MDCEGGGVSMIEEILVSLPETVTLLSVCCAAGEDVMSVGLDSVIVRMIQASNSQQP